MLSAACMMLVGFIVLVWSADLFADGAASIAKNMGMSRIIVSSPGHAYLGHTLGTLLVSSYALYYYSLYSDL